METKFEGLVEDGKRVEAHWLPCNVGESGATAHGERFRPSSGEASFRGRHLRGKSVALPNGFAGAVMERTDDGFRVVASLGTEFTYWNHDDDPCEAIDKVPRAMSWLLVSRGMSTKVDPDAVSKRIP